jgi:hypothetical protein
MKEMKPKDIVNMFVSDYCEMFNIDKEMPSLLSTATNTMNLSLLKRKE